MYAFAFISWFEFLAALKEDAQGRLEISCRIILDHRSKKKDRKRKKERKKKKIDSIFIRRFETMPSKTHQYSSYTAYIKKTTDIGNAKKITEYKEERKKLLKKRK